MARIDFRPALVVLLNEHGLNNVLEELQSICGDFADRAASKGNGEMADQWRDAADGLAYSLRTSIPGDL